MGWFERIEAEWRDAVARWVALVQDFQTALEYHYANRHKAEALGPAELQKWQNHLDHALRVKTAVEILQESIAATSSWARQTFGLSGLRGMAQQLGAIPLIPVAVIIGSISTVTGVIYALYSYNAELNRKWEYIRDNPDMTPAEITRLIESSSPIPALGSVQGMAAWIVIGGLILFFAPRMLKGMRK